MSLYLGDRQKNDNPSFSLFSRFSEFFLKVSENFEDDAQGLVIEHADVFTPLCAPARLKGAYGGRGSGKSHFAADQVLIKCLSMYDARVICLREVQNSIKESVRQLLIDRIQQHELGWAFVLLENELRCALTNARIVFRGMNHFNAENIKSLEGFILAWVEEAQTMRQRSLDLLIPTIRRAGSELLFTWNPRHETDAVDRLFRENPSSEAISVEANWTDNPWFPEVLKPQVAHDYKNDPEKAAHVWGGGYELIAERYYYAKDIKRLEDDGRLGNFPAVSNDPIDCSFDIGVHDYSTGWFFQLQENYWITAVDYFEAQNQGAKQVVHDWLPEYNRNTREGAQRCLDIGREPYRYGSLYWPHDIAVREWGAGARERIKALIDLGIPEHHLRKGVAAAPADRIGAVREIMPRLRFNVANPRVKLGVQRLRRYARAWNQSLQTYTGPLKDGNDHCADAFGEFAINVDMLPIPEKVKSEELSPEALARVPLEEVGRRVSKTGRVW